MNFFLKTDLKIGYFKSKTVQTRKVKHPSNETNIVFNEKVRDLLTKEKV